MDKNRTKQIYITNEIYILIFAILGVVMLFGNLRWLGIIQLVIALVAFLYSLFFKTISKKKIQKG